MNARYRFPLFISLVVTFSLTSCIHPRRAASRMPFPLRPDYSNPLSWAALPTLKDSADALAPGLHDGQADARVDVFFVHPTTYLLGHHWNANPSWKQLNRFTDKGTIRNQASVFNESCKVYAPRYRQAIIGTYRDKKGNAVQVFDTAYADVKAAFQYYLKHYNQGRPIIIASHSQGTDHAIRLMHDFFEKDPSLSRQLVACYLIGRPIAADTFKLLVPCDSASQTGCFVTWNTVKWGETAQFGTPYQHLICVNPLSWKRDSVYTPSSLNKGALRSYPQRIEPLAPDAKCSPEGLLWVHALRNGRYPPNVKNYHIYDYNYFYLNIRENVKERIAAYFRKQKK
jgi:hypothetical protein